MKILILGGTGAMGSPLIDILANSNNEIHVTSRNKRISEKSNIIYLEGDAHETKFLQKLFLNTRYDAVVDFMIYSVEELEKKKDIFLNNTNQYIFISSSRVYADSFDLITEESPRLLDVCEDKEYLSKQEYALEKARQENIFFKSKNKNWTIIRPYITYYAGRFQLGVLEKEQWLRRALLGKTIVFSKDIAQKTTTLTYGKDVAECIALCIGNKKALGEVFHCATGQFQKWTEVLQIYLKVIYEETGIKPRVILEETSEEMIDILHNDYQVKYDRLYNRKFDNLKVAKVLGKNEYMDIEEGIRKSMHQFINNFPQYAYISWEIEAYFDRLSKEFTKVSDIPYWKSKIKYVFIRYLGLNFHFKRK